MTTVTRDLQRLRRDISDCGSVVVAFSGGVDSSVVLAVAAEVLGPRALAVNGVSPSVSGLEATRVVDLARDLGAELIRPETHEFDDPAYVANDNERCFYCKRELFRVCREIAAERGLVHVLDGTHADDVGDWRPGRRAAAEAGVHSPLLACGLGKQAVRALAQHLGLPHWNAPAEACLASRLPYGTTVTAARLRSVAQVETAVHEAGFRQVRARHHGATVRVEVDPERVADLHRLVEHDVFVAVARRAGFAHIEVEPEGYRSGRLNDVLRAAP